MRNSIRTLIVGLVALCTTALAHGQPDQAFTHFFSGNCEEQRLITELGKNISAAKADVLEYGLQPMPSPSDTVYAFATTKADIIVILTANKADRIVGISVFMQRTGKAKSSEEADILEKRLSQTYLAGKLGTSYRQDCPNGPMYASVKSTKLGAEWYLNMTLATI